MNRAQLISEIRRLVRDPAGNNPRWSAGALSSRIDMAQDWIASRARAIPSTHYITTVANTAEYALNQYLIALESCQILINSVYNTLQRVTEAELDGYSSTWRDVTGTPTMFYVRGNYLGLYPAPDTATASAVQIYQYDRPLSLSADSMVPFNGVYELYPYHRAICYEVARQCELDNGAADKAANYASMVEQQIRTMKNQIHGMEDETRMINVYEFARQNSLRSR